MRRKPFLFAVLQRTTDKISDCIKREGKYKMDRILQQCKRMALIFLIGGVTAMLLLFLVYLIPVERMKEHALQSVPLLENWGVNPQLLCGYHATTLDTYTDAWMLRIAFYDGDEPAFRQCLANYNYGYPGGKTRDLVESVITYLSGEEGYVRMSYARYWHGYLTVLKPLLYFFDYGDILQILKFMQLGSVIGCAVLLYRRGLGRYIPAFAATLCCVEFHTIGMSMQYAWVFLIAMACTAYLLWCDEKAFLSGSADLAFLIAGMCTSYFDLLTYPMFTLGIPLSVMILRRCSLEPTGRLGRYVLRDFWSWGVGYGGMWILKWILATVFTGENLIADGVGAFLNRTGGVVDGEPISYMTVLLTNLWELGKYPYVLAVLCACVVVLVQKGRLHRLPWQEAAVWLLVMLLPFLWYAISKNHSYIHSWMAYRELGISVFAGLCFLTRHKASN